MYSSVIYENIVFRLFWQTVDQSELADFVSCDSSSHALFHGCEALPVVLQS